MRIILLILFLFSIQTISAQNQLKIDSVQVKLDNTTEDTVKIKLLLELSELYYRGDLVKSLEKARQALQISEKIKNDLYVARSRAKIGDCLIFIGVYDEALSNLLICLKLARKNNFQKVELSALVELGVIQDRIGRFDEALKYYFDALSLYNRNIESGGPLRNVKTIQALYNNIGNIYLSSKDLTTAEEYYLKGLALSEERNDNINIGIICNNLGKLEMQRNNYPKAFEYLTKSLKAREKIDDKSGIAKSYYFLSSYYQNTNQDDKALTYAEYALKLSSEVKEPLTGQIAAMFLYEINKKLGKYEEALKYHELYKQLSDSLINDNKIREMTSLQLKYNYEKDEKEKEAEQQKIRFKYMIFSLTMLLGLVILGLLFGLSRSRNKRIKLENDQLEKDMVQKNKELTTNVIYLLKKNELIDSITVRLLNLKSQLKGDNVDQLQRIILDLQSVSDKEVWSEFEYRFQNVHEEFYQTLREKFPNLSPSEIRLAAFLRLNMTSKEISSITGQSVNSLETARYRLRKKLGITNQEVNLVNFLLNV